MLRSKNIFLLLFFITFFSLYSSENKWILAAKQFELVDVPSSYHYLAQAVPKLILSDISIIGSRVLTQEEIKEMKEYTYQQEKQTKMKEIDQLQYKIDTLYFSIKNKKELKKEQIKLEKQIKEKKKELERIDSDFKKTAKNTNNILSNEYNIGLYKGNTDLYTPQQKVPLRTSLQKEGISALITGTIEDISGYLYITVYLETGLIRMPLVAINEASSYDEINKLIKNLTTKLLPYFYNKKIVSLSFNPNPSDTYIYLDTILVDTEKKLAICEGEYSLYAFASGYEPYEKKIKIGEYSDANVLLTMTPLPTVTSKVQTSTPVSVIINSENLGLTPQSIHCVSFPVAGLFFKDDVNTWFVLENNPRKKTNKNELFFKVNSKSNKTVIEKQRSIMYWSLGAFYISLPIALLLYGDTSSSVKAYTDGKIPNTLENYTSINKKINTSYISTGISIGLGIQYGYQVAKYLYTVNKILPQTKNVK